MFEQKYSELLEETESLASIAMHLLKPLDREPKYVKELIGRILEKLLKEGWIKEPESKPWIDALKRENYVLKVAFIHAKKGEKITGADLVFELKNKKIVLVQSKRTRVDGRIYFNRFQLFKLFEIEAMVCGHHILFPLCPYLYLFNKPTVFFHLIMRSHVIIEEKLFHISEVLFALNGRKSVSESEFLGQGLSIKDFEEMFWRCKIGGPDLNEHRKRDILYFYSLFTNRLVILLNVEEV